MVCFVASGSERNVSETDAFPYHPSTPEGYLARACTANVGRIFIEAPRVLERVPVEQAWFTACPGAGSKPREEARRLGREPKLEGQDDLLALGLVRDFTPGGLVRPGPARDGVAIACR
jgi:hypothetical protein